MTSEEAIKHIQDIICENTDAIVFEVEKKALKMAIKALEKRKTGKWITDKKSVYGGVFLERECHCSECGLHRDFIGWKFDNYCPNCGVKMEANE